MNMYQLDPTWVSAGMAVLLALGSPLLAYGMYRSTRVSWPHAAIIWVLLFMDLEYAALLLISVSWLYQHGQLLLIAESYPWAGWVAISILGAFTLALSLTSLIERLRYGLPRRERL